jgi:hypothetical protein
MKTFILAAVAVMTLGVAVAPAANASSVKDDSAATRMQQTGSYSR